MPNVRLRVSNDESQQNVSDFVKMIAGLDIAKESLADQLTNISIYR